VSTGASRPRHYLSIYMAPPDETALAPHRHDHCAALWRDHGTKIELARYWEFERLSGLKHHRIPLMDRAAARDFVNSLLEEEGLELDALDAVWGTPWLETDRSYEAVADGTALPLHNLSHLFAALLVDWKIFREETIVGLALDFAPDWTLDRARVEMAYAGCVSTRGTISIFPVESPAALWLVAAQRFGREEGTLMALASATTCEVPAGYGLTSVLGEVELWSPVASHGPADRAIEQVTDTVERLLEGPTRAECRYDERFDLADNLQSAVMKIVDAVSTDVVERNLARIQASHGVDFASSYLAMGGGYALNCPNNTRVLNRHGFRGFLAPPCVNDSGQALGIGLMALYSTGAPMAKSFRLDHAYWGRERLGIEAALERFAPFVKSVDTRDLDQVVDDISNGPIAWVDGPSEIGPRALGHRSILGDPTNPETKIILNTVKGRQWWRPVAPMVLADEVGNWFDTERLSPFMLEAIECRPDRASRVPAVLHLDGTARVQTVSRDDEPLLHALLEKQHWRTGVPILCNTSLNDRGEPIVDDAEQALNFCVRKGLSVAYVGPTRVELEQAAFGPPTEPSERRGAIFQEVADSWSEAWRSMTERGISVEAVFLAGWSPEIRERLLDADRDPKRLARLTRFVAHLVDRMSDAERNTLLAWVDGYGPDGHPASRGPEIMI
jgi:carbamoyltransferase